MSSKTSRSATPPPHEGPFGPTETSITVLPRAEPGREPAVPRSDGDDDPLSLAILRVLNRSGHTACSPQRSTKTCSFGQPRARESSCVSFTIWLRPQR